MPHSFVLLQVKKSVVNQSRVDALRSNRRPSIVDLPSPQEQPSCCVFVSLHHLIHTGITTVGSWGTVGGSHLTAAEVILHLGVELLCRLLLWTASACRLLRSSCLSCTVGSSLAWRLLLLLLLLFLHHVLGLTESLLGLRCYVDVGGTYTRSARDLGGFGAGMLLAPMMTSICRHVSTSRCGEDSWAN